MKVLVTGAGGFLGRRLVNALLQRGALREPDGRVDAIDRVILVDIALPSTPADPRIAAVSADLTNPDALERVLTPDVRVIFHLAAVVSGQAESDFDLGMRVNVDATRRLLDVCRRHDSRPRLIFASSIAVFGISSAKLLPETASVSPKSSYGMQKAVAELLIADCTRRGDVDGRILRLPTISIRPGRPNAAASSFASGIVREPLNGEPAVCPVAPDTRLWLASPATAVGSLVLAAEIDGAALGSNRVLHVPGISVTPREMVAALERAAGPEAARLVAWGSDPRIEAIVATWPGALDARRALDLGFPHDEGFDAIVCGYMRDELGATSPP